MLLLIFDSARALQRGSTRAAGAAASRQVDDTQSQPVKVTIDQRLKTRYACPASSGGRRPR